MKSVGTRRRLPCQERDDEQHEPRHAEQPKYREREHLRLVGERSERDECADREVAEHGTDEAEPTGEHQPSVAAGAIGGHRVRSTRRIDVVG